MTVDSNDLAKTVCVACGHELDTWAYPGYTLGAIQNFLLPAGKGVVGGGIGGGGVQ